MKSEYAFDVAILTVKDKNTVIEFLRKFFYEDEPLNASMELIKNKDAIKNFENYYTRFLNEKGKFTVVILNEHNLLL